MYRAIEIRNFRGISALKVENLERVNLITGLNNVGKTTLLEAFFLAGSNSPESALKMRVARGQRGFEIPSGRGIDSLWSSLFHQYAIESPIILEVRGIAPKHDRTVQIGLVEDWEVEHSEFGLDMPAPDQNFTGAMASTFAPLVLKLEVQGPDYSRTHFLMFELTQGGEIRIRIEPSVPTNPQFPTLFTNARTAFDWSAIATNYGRLDKMGRQQLLLEALRLIEPRLERLSAVFEAGQPALHGQLGDLGRLLPLAEMGEGLGQLASIFLNIVLSAGGVLLIDEIGAGIHYSVLSKVWEVIRKAAEDFNTQIIATTHSRECVVAAHEAFSEGAHYDLGLYRLHHTSKGELVVADYDQETIAYAVEADLEVR